MRTIEISNALAEELRDWSEPLRVRFVDDSVPMLEFRILSPAEILEAAREHADYEAAQGFFKAAMENLGIDNLVLYTDFIVDAALGADHE